MEWNEMTGRCYVPVTFEGGRAKPKAPSAALSASQELEGDEVEYSYLNTLGTLHGTTLVEH